MTSTTKTIPATPYGHCPEFAPTPVANPRALTRAWRSGVYLVGWDTRRDAKRLARLEQAERYAPDATW